jgi:xylulokinase
VLQGWSYAALADAAAEVPPGSERLFFLPYLAGERTPHMDPQATGAFVGLTLRHGREHLARAVMEGVVFALRQGLDLMLQQVGVSAERIVASGGATAHPLWLQLEADIFNRPIYRTATIEAAAVGAALLAGVGAGVYAGALEASRRTVVWCDEIIDPVPENAGRLAEAYQTYCQLYPALAAVGFGKKPLDP